MSSSKRVYLFQEANATMRDLLGGKGATELPSHRYCRKPVNTLDALFY